MNRLAPIALAATLLAGAALPAAAQTEAAAAASAPASAAAPSGPPLKIDVNVVNPEDLLDTHRTLLIPTLYLQLLTEGRVAASKQSGFFSGGNNTAAAAASYAVEGLDKAYLQLLQYRAALHWFFYRNVGIFSLVYAGTQREHVPGALVADVEHVLRLEARFRF